VEEAAMFTRYFGDFAEANDDSRGIIWGEREWLDDDVPEVRVPPLCLFLISAEFGFEGRA
jgi:hypothetical protein